MGAEALARLREERGLDDETIRRWGLGYNLKSVWDKPERWGLPASEKKLWLPRGVVIPYWFERMLWTRPVRGATFYVDAELLRQAEARDAE